MPGQLCSSVSLLPCSFLFSERCGTDLATLHCLRVCNEVYNYNLQFCKAHILAISVDLLCPRYSLLGYHQSLHTLIGGCNRWCLQVSRMVSKQVYSPTEQHQHSITDCPQKQCCSDKCQAHIALGCSTPPIIKTWFSGM